MAQGAGQSQLEVELDRLRNSVVHLERSNLELRAAIATDGPDPDFKEAIQDNIVTIAKTRARIYALEEELRKLTGLAASPSEPLCVDNPEDTGGANASAGLSAPPAASGSTPPAGAGATAAEMAPGTPPAAAPAPDPMQVDAPSAGGGGGGVGGGEIAAPGTPPAGAGASAQAESEGMWL